MVFIYLFASCMLIEWLVLLHDLYSCFARPLLRFIFARLAVATTCVAAPQPEDTPPHVSQLEQAGVPAGRHVEKVENGTGKKKCLGVNPKTMMERIGTFWDPDDQREGTIGVEEVSGLFVDDEPSLDEVKEAFGVFDKNGDGFIDVEELQDVFGRMGFSCVDRRECESMIAGYDDDRDGKISFREFLKVVEDGFV